MCCNISLRTVHHVSGCVGKSLYVSVCMCVFFVYFCVLTRQQGFASLSGFSGNTFGPDKCVST